MEKSRAITFAKRSAGAIQNFAKWAVWIAYASNVFKWLSDSLQSFPSPPEMLDI